MHFWLIIHRMLSNRASSSFRESKVWRKFFHMKNSSDVCNKELKRDASTHKFVDEILIFIFRAANRFYDHFYLALLQHAQNNAFIDDRLSRVFLAVT